MVVNYEQASEVKRTNNEWVSIYTVTIRVIFKLGSHYTYVESVWPGQNKLYVDAIRVKKTSCVSPAQSCVIRAQLTIPRDECGNFLTLLGPCPVMQYL